MAKKNNKSGILVISLDFEMFWGIADCADYRYWKEKIEKVYEVVPRLIESFERHGIHATWATVGALMCEDKEEFLRFLPKPIAPQTERILKGLGIWNSNENACPANMLFAPDLVRMVSMSEGQEIGTHTFSHYYCDNPTSSVGQFAAEINAAFAVTQMKGYSFKTIVFPRNQIESDYLAVLSQTPLCYYRGTEESKITELKKKNYWGVLLWYLDNYIPLQKTCSYRPDVCKNNGELSNIRNSRFYKPYRPQYRFFENIKLLRYKNEMRLAAKRGEVYHMYWHPYNFSENTEINFAQLETILSYFDILNHKYGMRSMNISEVGEYAENH